MSTFYNNLAQLSLINDFCLYVANLSCPFMHCSDPNEDGLTHWPQYAEDTRLYVDLNRDSVTLGANVHKDNVKLLLETIPNQIKLKTKTEL